MGVRSSRLVLLASSLLAACAPSAPRAHEPAPEARPAQAKPTAAAASISTSITAPGSGSASVSASAPAPGSATASASGSATGAAATTSWSDCRVEAPPPQPATPPKATCAPISPRIKSELQPKLLKKYSPTCTGATLAISYDCDPITQPAELIFESGSGHGGTLVLLRLRFHGRILDALRITRPSYFTPSAPPIQIERAELDSGSLDARLPAIRALILAKLEERKPKDPHDGSESFSSNDWHGLARLEDTAGRAIERSFTGYESTPSQLQSMPVAEIAAQLEPVVESITWQAAPADADARSFFVRRFLAAGPERAEWWVKERFVQLAEHVGTPALVPKLIDLAQDKSNDAAAIRTRDYALTALAALAGFDARRDNHGKPLSVDAAADAYARACRRAEGR